MKIIPLATDVTANQSARPNMLALLRGRVSIIGVGLWLLFVALFAAIQFVTPNLSSTDDYFHIRFAQVMRTEGLRPNFIWLPLTILNAQNYYDHHFLYHVLLIPFTYGQSLREGAKWSGILFPATAFLMGWIVIRGQGVPYAWLWAVGFFAVSEAFLYRMSMVRVQSVSLFMLLWMLHVTLKKQHRWLLPLAFVYTWLYDAFPLLLLLIAIIVGVRWLFDRRLDLSPLIYTAAGVALGLVINPYFPNNITFIYHHILAKVLELGQENATAVGGEWYPFSTWTLAENSGGALLVFVAGAFALGLNKERMNTPTAVLFFAALFFGLLLFKSRRFVEYYPAFALIFCAVAWKPVLEAVLQAETKSATLVPLILGLVIIPATLFNIKAERANLLDTTPYQRYEQASAWLVANTPPGSMVFQTDWDDFPRLYYYNTHNIYTLGLDPTYMERYNAPLYKTWQDTTNGWGNIGLVIQQEFGAQYAITDLEHYGFLDKAQQDPYMQELYRDEYAVIFGLTTQPDPTKFNYYGKTE